MQQIKIFKGLESDLPALEKAVNSWLAESKARVIQVCGNIAPQSPGGHAGSGVLQRGAYPSSDVLLLLLYEPA